MAPRRVEGPDAWRTLAACVGVIILAVGTRTALAAFLRPIEADLGLDRAVLSTAGALTVLMYGIAQPLVGALANRVGPRHVMLGGLVLTTLGGIGVASATQPWQLIIFAGILPGIAFAAASSVPAAVLLAGWFTVRLGIATGILSAAIPAGQSMFVPLATGLIPVLGWRQTYVLLAIAVALIGVPLLVGLARDPPVIKSAAVAPRPKIGIDIWLLGVGFFACGFSDQFVSLHLVALASDNGIAPLTAAGLLSALLLIGVLGSVASGPIADRTEPRHLLAALYLLRAVAAPLIAGSTFGISALALFALLFGPTYIANQAPGARLVRDRYGVGAVGVLMGSVGLAHQVGGSLGVAAGGFSVAQFGSYGPSVLLVMLVILTAGLVQLFIPPAKNSEILPMALSRGDHRRGPGA